MIEKDNKKPVKKLLSLVLGLMAPKTKEPSINPEKQAFKTYG